MASIEQRLARMEAHAGRAPGTPDIERETREYGTPLWTLGPQGHRAYGAMREGMHWLTIVEADGTPSIVYVSAFDPAGPR
jgi:hypothetical protein